MATVPTLPTEHVDRILRAVAENLNRISPADDSRFAVKTTHVGISDADLDSPPVFKDGTTQGVIFVVTDKSDVYEYLTAARVRAKLTYDVECFLKREEADFPGDAQADDVRVALLNAVQAFFTAHWDDIHLAAADARLNGAPEVRLVTNHRIARIERQYEPPDAYFRATVTCLYDFSANASG